MTDSGTRSHSERSQSRSWTGKLVPIRSFQRRPEFQKHASPPRKMLPVFFDANTFTPLPRTSVCCALLPACDLEDSSGPKGPEDEEANHHVLFPLLKWLLVMCVGKK